MGTDTALTTMVFYRCIEVDWENTAVKDGFDFYTSPNGEVHGLSEESVQVNKKVRYVYGVSTTLTLSAATATFRAGLSRTELVSTWQKYDDYHGQSSDCGEAERL